MRTQALALLAALALLGALVLFRPFGSEGNPGFHGFSQRGAVVTAMGYPGLDQDSARTLREMETHYQVRQASLAPTLRATFRQSLESLDNSIQECLRHCQREPHNHLAREYLLSAYQSKAEVLAAALEMDGR